MDTIPALAKDMGARWWTSGTDVGCPGKLAWCGSGEMYSEPELGRLEGSSDSLERCVVLKAASTSSAVLNAASCDEFNRPLCEVNKYFYFIFRRKVQILLKIS